MLRTRTALTPHETRITKSHGCEHWLSGRVAQVAASKAKRLGLVHDLIEPLGPGLNAPDEVTLAHLEKVAIEAAKCA